MNISGLHIEPTNICTLKCPGCARTRFIDKWPQHWHNHNIDINQLLKFLDIDLTGIRINLCGNYGDPIYHPDLIEFVDKLKQQGAILSITTNGSYKKTDWWKNFVKVLTVNDTVVFSVDGTPENFTQYRVNADWNSIHEAMTVCASSSCKTKWKYIPFSYNHETIESARQLSNQIGIDEFSITPSDRYDAQTMHFKPGQQFVGERFQLQQQWKNSNIGNKINPMCNNGDEHFITAEGYYSPCCYLADHRFYYKTPFGKNKEQYNIKNYTLTEILSRPQTVEFFQTLDQNTGCQYNCPA
jgi:organic radical activating enzyme